MTVVGGWNRVAAYSLMAEKQEKKGRTLVAMKVGIYHLIAFVLLSWQKHINSHARESLFDFHPLNSQFWILLVAPTVSVYTRRFIGELLCDGVSKCAQRGAGSLSVVELSAQDCNGNGEAVEGRLSSTIIYLIHIHGRGRGSYLAITSSFVFVRSLGNLLLLLLGCWCCSCCSCCFVTSDQELSWVEWEMGWFWDMGFRGFDSNGRGRRRILSTTIVGMGAAAGVSWLWAGP